MKDTEEWAKCRLVEMVWQVKENLGIRGQGREETKKCNKALG